MNKFIEYILQFGNLNKEQIEFIKSKAIELELCKGEYFWVANKIPQRVGFIVEGVLRTYQLNDNGEENTHYFFDENNLILGWEKFEGSIPPIQAVTDCKFIAFSIQEYREISATIVCWNDIAQNVIEKISKEKMKRRSVLVDQNATTRYVEFLEKFPTLINRVPLS